MVDATPKSHFVDIDYNDTNTCFYSRIASVILAVVFLIAAIFEFCLGVIGKSLCIYGCHGYTWLYIFLGLALSCVLIFLGISHKRRRLRARMLDPGLITQLHTKARSAALRQAEPPRPDNIDQRRREVEAELARLESLPELGRNEAEYLHIMQTLVDFLPLDQLIAEATYRVEELENEYSEDPEDQAIILKWKDRVTSAIEAINDARKGYDPGGEKDVDRVAERLRAVHKAVIENFYDYYRFWTVGAVILHDLIIAEAVAVIVLTILGIFPALPAPMPEPLQMFHWGLLGISGALVGSMLALLRKETISVGQTEGEKELWRAVLSVPLGFVAGILVYCIRKAGLIESGSIVPVLDSASIHDLGLSVLWAFTAGLVFQPLLESMRSTPNDS